MNYSIVIVTYNRLDKLKKCIENASNQNISAHHIIIINNASTDGTTNFLGEESFRQMPYVIVNMPENTGGAGGFAKGVEIARQLRDDWVLLIDDDAMLKKDYVEEILKNKDSDVLAYSGSVLEADKLSLYHRRRVRLSPTYAEVDVSVDEYKKEYFDYDLSSFCGLFISMNLINKIGLPKRDFFIWYDDTEYSLRIREHSAIRNINAAQLRHEIVVNQNGDVELHKMKWKDYYGLRNRLYTIKEHGTKISYIYEIIFLRLRWMKYFIWRIIGTNDKKKIGQYNSTLLSAAIKDGKNKKLMKNEKYLP